MKKDCKNRSTENFKYDPTFFLTCDECDDWNNQAPTSLAEQPELLDPHLNVNPQTPDNFESLARAASSDIKTPPPKILYHLISKDHEGTVVENIESAHPFPRRDETGVAKTLTDETVLEVLTTKTSSNHFGLYRPPMTKNELKIYSAPLINALQHVVQYWPGLSLLAYPVTLTEPYAVLVHHMDALKNHKNNHPASHSSEFREVCNDHIDVLLDFLDKTYGDVLRLEQARYRKSPPSATFENLWMLFKPGQDVYIKARENKPAIPMRLGTFEGSLRGPYVELQGWGVSCNGTQITPQSRYCSFNAFDGEKEIFSLEAYPKEFHDESDYEQELQKRGQRYWEFCGPAYKQYIGTTIADRNHPRVEVCTDFLGFRPLYFKFLSWQSIKLNGRIVIDFNAYNQHQLEDTKDEFDVTEYNSHKFHFRREFPSSWRQLPSPRGCECQMCGSLTTRTERSDPIFAPIHASMAKREGNPELYFLSDYVICGYALKERKWCKYLKLVAAFLPPFLLAEIDH